MSRGRALSAAREKLENASRKLAAMEAAIDVHDLNAGWSEFLTEVQRCYLKLIKATEHGPTKAWCDRLKHERKTDELLVYTHHARNADEHGIDPIALVKPGSLTIGDPGEVTIIRSAIITSQGVFGDIEGGTVRYTPASIRLQPVVDRSQTYRVPTTHQGQALADLGPIEAARLTLTYLRRIVAEAEDLP